MKTETKFTKGEWKIRKAIPVPSKSGSIEIFTEDIIAVGINTESDEDYMAIAFCGHFQNEQALANAKLIAAAPELLEALIMVSNLNKSAREHISDGFFEKVNNAIKKATE